MIHRVVSTVRVTAGCMNINELMMNIDDDGRGTDDVQCMSDVGWTFSRDHTQTVAVDDDDSYLILSLNIGGFHGDEIGLEAGRDNHKQQIAELSFEFETRCLHRCEFALLWVWLMLLYAICLSVSVIDFVL